ncbi:hypothetical protein CC2G_015048 [Coprinopsis cinerea AmutBmut pab1-1]|nr:hypothetical protein CC2G_015048 [Coprinopsis cinerea AmutBmut pab1-1]
MEIKPLHLDTMSHATYLGARPSCIVAARWRRASICGAKDLGGERWGACAYYLFSSISQALWKQGFGPRWYQLNVGCSDRSSELMFAWTDSLMPFVSGSLWLTDSPNTSSARGPFQAE